MIILPKRLTQCRGAGAGGAKIILCYRSRNQSHYKLFRLRLLGSGRGLEFAHLFFALLLKIAHFKERIALGDVSDSLVIRVNRSHKTSGSLKKFVFFVCFLQFSPLFYVQEQIAPFSLCSFALF